MQETWARFSGWKDLLEKELQPIPIFLPGKFHGQRSLVDYSPQCWKELDVNEWLSPTPHTYPQSYSRIHRPLFRKFALIEYILSLTTYLSILIKQNITIQFLITEVVRKLWIWTWLGKWKSSGWTVGNVLRRTEKNLI